MGFRLPWFCLNRAGWITAIALLGAISGVSADPWLKLKTSNFELYTTAGERRGREAILHFEKVRDFFLKAGKLGSSSETPVRIIAFRSQGEYRPYQPAEFVAAFYQGGSSGQDYIVMGTLSGSTYPIAVHEYVHLLVRHSGSKLPPWMNEGMAELFSTLRPVGNQVEIGSMIPGRLQSLHLRKWLDLETLTGVDQDSPHYNDRERAEIFYAQSWALTHMLWLSDAYREKLADFLRAIHSEKSSAETFQSVYRKSLKEVQHDLEGYVRRDHVRVGNYDVKLEKSAETVTTEPVPPLQSAMMLAELLVYAHKVEEGRKAYLKLAEESPQDDVEAAEALGYFAWRSLREPEEGQRHFARAVELGSRNAMVYFDYAMLLREKQINDPMILPLLEKAVELKPDLADAQYELGARFYQEKMYARSVVHFNQIRQVSRERAVPMFRAMAYAYHQLGDSEEARKAAEQARQYSRSLEEIAEAEQLLEYVSYRPPTRSEAETETPVANALNEAGNPRNVAEGYGEEPGEGDDGDKSAETPVRRRRTGQAGNETIPAVPGATVRQLPPRTPLESAEGTLRQFDCMGSSARLVIDASGTEVKFVIRDPNTILLRGTDSYSVDFTCGEQEPKTVVILYEPIVQEDLGTVGVVRVIEFK
jgi:tetratricopeptide (TPR) repeat protein